MPDFTTFKAAFKGDIVLPTDSEYDRAIARWSVTAERKAAVIAFVKDEEDVVLTINYAKENKLPLAIRGGGHNPAGASSVENGVVIDLSRHLTSVRVDAEKRLAYVGGGALWEAVDKEASKHGLATVGGTVNHTGVGGLTLGGGFGWLSGQYGLVIDNLAQVGIVPATGPPVVANESTNPDLFWAVKGGGSNFGVVTEFVLKLHSQRATVYAGPLIFSPEQTKQLNAVTAEWYKNAGEKEGMIQVATVAPDGNPAIFAMVFYNGTEAEGRAAFNAFFDIGPVADHSAEVPINKPIMVKGSGSKELLPRLPAERNMAAAHQRAIKITKSPESAGIRPSIFFEYFPLRKINSVASDATAFPRDITPSIVMYIAWPGDQNEEMVDGKTKIQMAREFANELADIVTQGHNEFGLAYTNYTVDGANSKDKAEIALLPTTPGCRR